MSSPVSRRVVLQGILVGGAVAAPVVTEASEPQPDLQHWLDTADPYRVIDYHALRLADAMGKVDPSRTYVFRFDLDHGFGLLVGRDI